MKTKDSKTRFKRTWFCLNAKVTIGPEFLHKAGFGNFLIPHPSVANWLLRLGLPGNRRCKLSFAHEFAHFQTAPLLFVYMLVIIVLAYARGRLGFGEVLFLLISMQAAWEIMSEGLLLLKDSAAYRKSYIGITRLPRLIFWATGGIFAAAGWVLILFSQG